MAWRTDLLIEVCAPLRFYLKSAEVFRSPLGRFQKCSFIRLRILSKPRVLLMPTTGFFHYWERCWHRSGHRKTAGRLDHPSGKRATTNSRLRDAKSSGKADRLAVVTADSPARVL
jgi:hypothetical protein